MSGKTLYDKIWDAHVVSTDANGESVLYIDLHLIHEVTTPQAFAGLKAAQTWHATRTIQMCREACGGAGYTSLFFGEETAGTRPFGASVDVRSGS